MILLNKTDRYIIKNITSSFAVVLFALLTIDFISKFIAEADIIGENNYSFAKVILYILSIAPLKLIEFFPIALLIGSLMGLGKLSSSNELTIIQSMGISKLKIGFIGSILSLFLGIICLITVEFIGFPLNSYASNMRAEALQKESSLDIKSGVWAQDKNNFIKVDGTFANGDLAGITIYTIDDQSNFLKVVKAKRAIFSENEWLLKDVISKKMTDKKIITNELDQLYWQNNLKYSILKLLLVEPDELSIRDLNHFISYQKANHINSTNYILIFWQHLFIPFTAAVMFLLALPFAFGSNRNSNQGKKLFIGILLGLIYFISYSSISNIIILTGVNPILGAILPILLFTMISFILLRLRC